TYPPEENASIVSGIIVQLKTQGAWFGEFSNRKKDGTQFTTYARITALELSGKKYWVCVQEDITERKQTEKVLQRTLDELEMRVKARTAQLSSANAVLEMEVVERKQAEEELRRVHDELEIRVEER